MWDDDLQREPEEFELRDVTIKWKTDLACLIEYEEEEIWIPISQILHADIEDIGDTGNITIPEWLAIEKGL